MNTTLFTIDEFTPDTHLAPGGYDTTEVIDDGNPDTYLLRQTSFQTCDWVAPGERIEGGTRVYEWREPRANWDARIHEARQRDADIEDAYPIHDPGCNITPYARHDEPDSDSVPF